MRLKDLPKVPRPNRQGDWDFYDCVRFAEKMNELWPEIKKLIKLQESNQKANENDDI